MKRPLLKSGLRRGWHALFLAALILAPWMLLANTVPGTTAGQFAVAPDGSAGFTVPIKVSPGTAGMEPKISLSYSNRGGVGVAGFGWTVTGVSAIQRAARNLPDDGVVRGVRFDEHDALLFDGEKLVAVGQPSADQREFRTRVDGLARVTAHGWTAAGPSSFIVETRAGLILEFGRSADALVKLPGERVLIWLCNRVEDRSGNYMTIAYAASGTDYRITQIAYTGNARTSPPLVPYATLTFEYETLAPQDLRFALGEAVDTRHRLKSIISRYGSELFRRYVLRHTPIDGRSALLLTQIDEFGRDDAATFRPLSFRYADTRPGRAWQSFDRFSLPKGIDFAAAADTRAGFRFTDVDGDGSTEVIYRTRLESETKSAAFVHDGQEWVSTPKLAPPIDLAANGLANTSVRLIDVDGQGGIDLVATGAGGGTFLASAAGWKSVAAIPPVAFDQNGQPAQAVLMLDVDRDQRNGSEILWSSTQTGAGAARFDGARWASVATLTPPRPLLLDGTTTSGAFAMDVDCDGQDELVYHRRLIDGTSESAVYAVQSDQWSEVKDPAFQMPIDPVPHPHAMRVADLNADGCMDLVASYSDGATTVSESFIASTKGWMPDPRGFPPIVFWRNGTATDAWLIDVDGDGRADLLEGKTATSGHAARGLASGWQEEPGLVPPARLSVQPIPNSDNGQIVRLGGSVARQLVYLAEPTGGGGLRTVYELVAATHTWTASDTFTIPVQVATFDKMDLGVRFPDLDGDGLADLAFTRKSGNTLTKHAYLFRPHAMPSAWVKDSRFEIPLATFSDDFKDTGVALADFNGDGLIDVLQSYRDRNNALTQKLLVNCHRSRTCIGTAPADSIWGEVTHWHIPKEAFADVEQGGLGARFLDINGDGRTDIAIAHADPAADTPLYAKTYLHDGAGWSEAPGLAPPVDFVRHLRPEEGPGLGTTLRDNRVEFMDLDGDRLPDVLYHFETWRKKPPQDPDHPPPPDEEPEFEKVIVSGARLNRDGAWLIAPGYTPPERLDPIEGRARRQVYLQDINGDGLVDLVYAERGQSRIHLNTGTGWTVTHGYALDDIVLSPIDGDQGFRFLDVNADGLVDISYSYKRDAAAEPVRGTYLNTGVAFVKADARFDPPPEVSYTEEFRGDIGLRPLDLNADGVVDLIQSYRRTAGESLDRVWLNIAAPSGAMPNALIATRDGLQLANEMTYRSLIGYEHAATGAQDPVGEIAAVRATYPVIDAPVPGQVVVESRVRVPGYAQRTSRYTYGIYRIEADSGRSLGFSWQQVRDVERRRTTRIHFEQRDGLVGTPIDTVVTQDRTGTTPVQVSRAQSEWHTRRRDGLALWNGHIPIVTTPLLGKTQSSSWDLGGELTGKQTDTFTYDAYSNVIEIDSLSGDDSRSRTVNTYADDISRWLLSRLATATVTLSRPPCANGAYCPYDGPATATRVASFDYDPTTGLLRAERSLVGTPMQLDVEYARDWFGNKVASTSRAVAEAIARRQTVAYDAQGRFVTAVINALGHRVSSDYDPVTGSARSTTDANGLTTRYTYDAFQRRVQETAPTGLVSTTQMSFPEDDQGGRYQVLTRNTVGSLPESRAFSDALGRVLLQRTVGFGGRPVLTHHTYDDLGRYRRGSLPHFEGDNVFWTERQFDAMDRVLRETRPDGSASRTEYAGLEVTRIDALGHRFMRLVDLRGRTVQTTDALGGVTRFRYDVSGNQTTLRNALGQDTRITYDLAGNRTSLDDPSAGVWSYTYDGFGQLRSQRDPNGNVLKLTYDALGRVLERTVGARQTTWAYDQGANAVGMPSAAFASNRSSKSFSYDAFGRLAVTSVAFGRDQVRIEQDYDELNRPRTRRYSTGVTLDHRYDAQGFWRKVELRANGESRDVWSGTTFDAFGRVTAESFGNGVVTTRTFDDRTGRLRFQDTLGSDSNGPLQRLALDYDELGNVRSRQDPATRQHDRFVYDALSRLREVSGTHAVTVAYDALGNILDKSDVGTYHYCDDASSRQRLCSTTTSDGESQVLEYDLAGNVTRIGERTLNFDDEGRAALIRRSRWSYAEFDYGADGEIVRQENREREVKYTAIYLADVELLREEYAPPAFPTPERTRIRNYVQSPSGAVGYFEHTYWHYPMRDAAPSYGDGLIGLPQRTTRLTTGFTYFVSDGLGSIQATVDDNGKPLQRFAYDPWGRRQELDAKDAYTDLRRGFTGHKQIDNLGLVHMGGRVYDPKLGRFASVDPFIQSPGYSQSHNRYAYAFNNPLRFVDPTGYFLDSVFGGISDFFGSVGRAIGSIVDATVGKPLRWIGEQLQKAGRWLSQNWRTVVVIAATIALSATGVGAIAAGAIIGGMQAALYGGSISDIARGAVIGALTSAAFSGVGDLGQAYNMGDASMSLMHGAVGGVSTVANGGDFTTGFAAAFLTRAASPGIEQLPTASARVAAAAVVGGTTSALAGGDFESGALTGAFSRAFNCEGHDEAEADGKRGIGIGSYDGEPLMEISLEADISFGSALGGPTCSATTGACSAQKSVGAGALSGYVGGSTQGDVTVGFEVGPSIPFGKGSWSPAGAGPFVNVSAKGVVSYGASARVLGTTGQVSATPSFGAGSYRAYGDLHRNVVNWICSQGGCGYGP